MQSSATSLFLSARNVELEHWSSVYGGWLTFWSVLVFVGVALELWVIWRVYREELHDFRRGIIHTPERPSRAKLIVELLGAGLVTVGIAGELIVSNNVESLTAELRRNSGKEVAEAREQAANAERETAQLYALTAPRRLTLEQQLEIGIACSGFAGQVVTLSSYPVESESSALVEQLVAALRSGNVNAMRIFSAPLFSGKPLSGFRVSGPNQPLVSGLSKTLQELGHLTMADPSERIVPEGVAVIEFGTLIPANLGRPQAHIFVGVKPITLVPTPAH